MTSAAGNRVARAQGGIAKSIPPTHGRRPALYARLLRPTAAGRHSAASLPKVRSTAYLDTSDKSSVMCAKAPMQCVGRQARKLRMTQMKLRLVIAGFHTDLRLCLDAIVDDDIQPVAFANGRNGTVRAVAEQLIDLGFIGHVDIVTEFCSQFRQAEVMRCGHHGQHIFAVAPQHDALDETIARDVACLSRATLRHAEFVQDLLVLDVFSGQILGAMDMT